MVELVTEKYRDFILDNFIEESLKVQLPKPSEDRRLWWVQLGTVVFMTVKIEVIEKYSRSFKARLTFDRYEMEQLFFTPLESAPTKIKEKIESKISKLVCKTFFDDNRHEDVLKMYKEKEEKRNSFIISALNKIRADENKTIGKIFKS
jgi:hypothetical protein